MEDRDLVLVNKVGEKREGLSSRELSGARETRRALEILVYPSQKNFDHTVHTIKNCPVTIEDFHNATTFTSVMFPPSKGKHLSNNPSASN